MGFAYCPSKIIFGDVSLTGFWTGTGSHAGNSIIKLNNEALMVEGSPRWTLTSTRTGNLDTANGDCGGRPVFSNRNNWSIYYCVYWQKWILIRNAPYIGYIPQTMVEYDPVIEDYDYTGDIWWQCTSIKTTPVKAAGSTTGEAVGTFTLGPSSSYPSLEDEDAEIVVTGDLTNTYYRRTEGSIFPYGTYENGIYVGYPLWTATVDNVAHNIVKVESEQAWVNLVHVSMRSADGHYLNTRYDGWVCPSICGGFNGDTARGFYATPSKPDIGQDFTLYWYHFVPDDPDDASSRGDIVQAEYYEDEEGIIHSHPACTAVWQQILYQDPDNYVPRAMIATKLNMAEVAIWR